MRTREQFEAAAREQAEIYRARYGVVFDALQVMSQKLQGDGIPFAVEESKIENSAKVLGVDGIARIEDVGPSFVLNCGGHKYLLGLFSGREWMSPELDHMDDAVFIVLSQSTLNEMPVCNRPDSAKIAFKHGDDGSTHNALEELETLIENRLIRLEAVRQIQVQIHTSLPTPRRSV